VNQNLSILFFKFLLKLKKSFYLNHLKDWCKTNIDSSTFIISFDFETQRDIDNLKQLTKKLHYIKLKPYYAIPGELIEKNLKLLKSLAHLFTFVNHGYKIHTEFSLKENINHSTLLYSKLNKNDIGEDIIKAHEVIKKNFGIDSKLFRTPHFGEYCEKKNMDVIYQILSKLNYNYSFSTTPIFSIMNKPIFKKMNITEIPCNAYLDNPSQIIDSWSSNVDLSITPKVMLDGIKSYIRLMKSYKLLLNVYFDPTDVVKNKEFFKVISQLAKYQKKNIIN
tara:strand:- start:409 stop:1242 length:834 start_codon:yes stop_codon:yes gene_type:complete